MACCCLYYQHHLLEPPWPLSGDQVWWDQQKTVHYGQCRTPRWSWVGEMIDWTALYPDPKTAKKQSKALKMIISVLPLFVCPPLPLVCPFIPPPIFPSISAHPLCLPPISLPLSVRLSVSNKIQKVRFLPTFSKKAKAKPNMQGARSRTQRS